MGLSSAVSELYLQFVLFAADQPGGELGPGGGQVLYSPLQVAHLGEQAFSLLAQLQLK